MKNGLPFTLWFEELLPVHVNQTGKKALSMAGMRRTGLRVPPGFAVTVEAWEYLMSETDLGDRISAYLECFGETDLKDLHFAEEAGNHISEFFEATPLPGALRTQLWEDYDRLSEVAQITSVPVAVRSSGTISRPGLFSSFLNVSGKDALEKKLMACWASTYSPRALAMRSRERLSLVFEPIGVVICQFIPARSAGVLFTAHPITGNPNRCVIEASWGLGESVVQACVTPDRFTVNRTTLEIEKRTVQTKPNQIIDKGDGTEMVSIPESLQELSSLSDDEIVFLIGLAEKVEAFFGGTPQDIEWAVSQDDSFPDNIFLLQSRPIVGVKQVTKGIEKPEGMSDPDHIAELMADRLFG